MSRGFFGIGIFHTKTPQNVGTLWRSAHNFGASFVFTVGKRYRKESSDTTKAWRSIPLYNYSDMDDLLAHLPLECRLIGVELDDKAHSLLGYSHPEQACYLLGAEDHGLNADAISRCHSLIYVPGAAHCLNVSVAGSIVLYSRMASQVSVDCPSLCPIDNELRSLVE